MQRLTTRLRRRLGVVNPRKPHASKQAPKGFINIKDAKTSQAVLQILSQKTARTSGLLTGVSSTCTGDHLSPAQASGSNSPEDESSTEVPDEVASSDENTVTATPTGDAEPDTNPTVDQSDGGSQTAISEPMQATPALSPEQAQALRNQQHWEFPTEEETDYTQGPARMAFATDGLQECAAVLMTLPLSQKPQIALQAQREFIVEDKKALRRQQALGRLLSAINAQISRRHIKQCDDDLTGDGMLALIQELAILDQMVEETKRQQHELKVDVECKIENTRRIYEDAIAGFEEVYVAAGLIEPIDHDIDLPYEEVDLQDEYQKFCEKQNEVDEAFPVPAAPLDTGAKCMMAPYVPMTEEEQKVHQLTREYWACETFLEHAQRRFDRRDEDRAQELQFNLDALSRGEPTTDASQDGFDVRWVKQMQEITRDLIDAEAALEAAKSAAEVAGTDVDLTNDGCSPWASPVEDGYRLSMEQELIDSVPSPKIKNWVTDIPDLASPSYNERFDVPDQWEAEDVDISGSVSLVAEGGDRKRIQKWRQICGL
ncbi:uncharacterized protein LTR77_008843 [Saxophila tyrrhenica]|uniref:Uncharacterized protein n=1 Tax=Saxophila tyrrhenica TaxID=1690608 RepID=A0AAV9P4A3_9PEZI|nr:hypothetical protein LTR77_008843 [Saxophila tyrrhenica]